MVVSAFSRIAIVVASTHPNPDLTDSNVLFEITGFQDWTIDQIYCHLGHPKKAPLLLLDGRPAPAFAPKEVVDAIDYSLLTTEHLSSNILITDFEDVVICDFECSCMLTINKFLTNLNFEMKETLQY